jgi:hypothetical protein
MKEMLEDLDRHRNDEARRIVWLQLVSPQFESMGIVLVAHFKHLLPLLYYWLHAQDETTQLLVIIHFCSGMKDLMNNLLLVKVTSGSTNRPIQNQ